MLLTSCAGEFSSSPSTFGYQNGDFYLASSASNCFIFCHDPLDENLACEPQGFYHRFAREGSFLPFANLRLANGSLYSPFSASHISHSLGFSLLPNGLCHRNCHLRVVLGDTTSQLAFRNPNSFTLSTDGSLGPLHSSNFASDCGSILYISSGATSCVGLHDDVLQSPLPNTHIHSTSSISAPLSPHCPLRLMNCIFPCNSLALTGFGAYHGNFWSGLSYLSTCTYLTRAFGVGDHSHDSPLPIASPSHTFALRIDYVMYDRVLLKLALFRCLRFLRLCLFTPRAPP